MVSWQVFVAMSDWLRAVVEVVPFCQLALRLPPSLVSSRPTSRSRIGGLSETVMMVRYPWWHRLVGGMLGGASRLSMLVLVSGREKSPVARPPPAWLHPWSLLDLLEGRR